MRKTLAIYTGEDKQFDVFELNSTGVHFEMRNDKSIKFTAEEVYNDPDFVILGSGGGSEEQPYEEFL